MGVDLLMAVAGLALLVLGGELLVRGATGVALLARASPGVIGLTVVAAGTSMPELVVSVDAALAGSPDLALSNVVGSNIYNVLLILGLAAVVRPLDVAWSSVRLEWPVMMLASWTLLLLARDGDLDRLEGGYFLVSIVVFVAWTVRMARRDVTPSERSDLVEFVSAQRGATVATWLRASGQVVVGVVLLGVGARMLVFGASDLASAAGVSERVIGLTLVALGTSLPELVTSVVASARGSSGIALGNVIGSNIFNVLGILGATALIHPISVNPQAASLDIWVMLAAAAVLLPIMMSGSRVSRLEGALLLVGATAWSVVLLRSG